jgi:formate/nitrite transporter FocA (FNT family)
VCKLAARVTTDLINVQPVSERAGVGVVRHVEERRREVVSVETAAAYEAATNDGRRRLYRSTTASLGAGFAGGAVLAAGVLAHLAVTGAAAPALGVASPSLLGAAAFGVIVALGLVGRAELLIENVSSAVAILATSPRDGWRRVTVHAARLAVLNVAGAAVVVVLIGGELPQARDAGWASIVSDPGAGTAAAAASRGVLAGVLLGLYSYLAYSVGSLGGRLAVGAMVGFLLTVGPFDYAILAAVLLMLEGAGGPSLAVGHPLLMPPLLLVSNLVGALVFVAVVHAPHLRRVRRLEQ